MNNRKLKLFIVLGVFLVVMLLGIYSLGDIKYSTKEGLSYDEKKVDANYLIDFIEKTYPYLYEVKADNGQDFMKEKSKIVNSISKTSSDKEFYDAIYLQLQRLTYGRADINVSTDQYDIPYTYLYENPEASKKTNLKKPNEIKSKWEAIQKEHRDNLFKQRYTCNIAASYINGSYYITMSQNPEVHVGDEVISINGISVDEYGKTIPFNEKYDKYDRVYDYDYEKYIVPSPFEVRSNLPKEIVIKNSVGKEKKTEVLLFDSKKPILENGFKSFEANFVIDTENNVQGKFLNTSEENKIIALDFSAINQDNQYVNSPEGIDKLLSKINESDYLILDLRRAYDAHLLMKILSFVLPSDINYYDYKIIEKNEINNAYINHFKGINRPSIAEVTSSIASLEKLYPLSKYHVFQDNRVDIKGMNKYKGKVFILYDKFFNSDIVNEILKPVIDQDLCTVISNGKFTLMDYYDSDFAISTVLPNSNLIATIQNSKVVDISGTLVSKIVITPQVIVKDDISKIIDNLKNGDGHVLKVSVEDKYTTKDEYYNEVLKLIK